MRTLGCDPDTHTLAIAIMDGRSLEAWWISAVPKRVTGDAAVAEVAKHIMGDFGASNWLIPPSKIVIEQMCVYPNTEIGKDGIDGLMRVASTGGAALACFMRMFPDADYAMPTAPEWKGQIKKAAHHRQILAQVDDETRKTLMAIPVTRRGHLLDAVGMALWAQGARGKRRETRKTMMARARAEARKARGG